MRKPSIIVLFLFAAAACTQVGCRMCQNCHDYSSPVANAACGQCNECRSGSCVASTATPEFQVVAQSEAIAR